MNKTDHILQVLHAIADDPRTPKGERAAARAAIRVHELKRDARAGEVTCTTSSTQPRDYVLVYREDSETWYLAVDGQVVGEWAGSCEIRFKHLEEWSPYDGDFLFSHRAVPRLSHIEIDALFYDDAFVGWSDWWEARHIVARVVVHARHVVYSCRAYVMNVHRLWHHTGRGDCTQIEFIAERFDGSFEHAQSRSSLALDAAADL